MKVESKSEASQSCPTLHDPMDCSLPGTSVHGIFQARVLEWGAVAFKLIIEVTSEDTTYYIFVFMLNHATMEWMVHRYKLCFPSARLGTRAGP